MKQVRPRVVYTTPILEHPPAGGPQLRVENSIKVLGEVCELHVVSRVPRRHLGGREAENFYRGLATEFSYAPTSRFAWPERAKKAARHILPSFTRRATGKDAYFLIAEVDRIAAQILWFGYGNISYDLMRAVREARPELQIVCDTDSVWSRFLLREVPFIGDPERLRTIERLGKEKEGEERDWARFADVTTGVSPVDVEYYRSIAENPERIHQFSNVIDVDAYQGLAGSPPAGFRRPAIYLAGTFGHPDSPMDRGARWMVERVLPRVLASEPDVQLYIVGKRSDVALGDLVGPGVTVTGQLPSVLPYLCNAAVAVVPLMFESGTRFKILEAGAAGVPIVSTSLGAEGLPVAGGEHLLLADNPEDFADSIVHLLRQPDDASRLARNCNLLVREHFGLHRLEAEAITILEYLSR